MAQELQVDAGSILCTSTRTDKVPNTSPTAASSGTDLNGMAAREAAVKIKARLLAFAAEHFQLDRDDVRLHNNRLIAGDREMPFAEPTAMAMGRSTLWTP